MRFMRCLSLLLPLGLACAGEFHLAWSKQLPPRHPANQWNIHVPKDRSYHLVEAENCLLIAIPDEDSLACIDRATGAERWRYFAEAAIRQAPVVIGDAALVGSEDGTIACLAVSDGALRWRYRPGPGGRMIIAHDRLADAWPIMTPLSIADNVAYGVCGNFPEDGVWGFAIELPSGKERWLRRLDVRVNARPTIAEGKVTFQGGPLAPARKFDALTGAPIPDPPAAKVVAPPAEPAEPPVDPTKAGKDDKPSAAPRTARIAWLQEGIRFPALAPAVDLKAALADNFVVAVKPPTAWTLHGPLPIAERPDTAAAWGPSKPLAPAETGLSGTADAGTEILAIGRFFMDEVGILLVNASADHSMRILVDGQPIIDTLATGNGLPVSEANAHTGTIRLGEGEHFLTVRCRAGTAGWQCRLTLGRCDQDNGVAASAIAFPGHGFPGLIAAPPAAGSAEVMLPGGAMRPVSRDRVLPGVIQVAIDAQTVTALTSDGRLIGFTAQRPESVRHVAPPTPPVPAIIRSPIAVEDGWVLVAGLDDGKTIERLIDERRWFRILAVDNDRTRVETVRRRLASQGRLFDGRTQIVAVDQFDVVPAWLADLVVSERSETDWATIARSIRPYGGRMILPSGFPAERAQTLAKTSADLRVIDQGGVPAITRPDGPAGSSGEWRERFADAGNSYGQAEPGLVFPLATRWFGGASSQLRWYKGVDPFVHEGDVWWGPMPVARGRWLLQGKTQIGCFDQYTGRKIWAADFPDYPLLKINERGRDPLTGPKWWLSERSMSGTNRIIDLSFGVAGYEQSCDDTTTYLAAGKELIAYDLATGAVRMQVKPPAELGGDLRWGRIQIPAQGGALVCTLFDPADNIPEGDGGDMPMSRIAVIDPANGSLRWHAQPRRKFSMVVANGRQVFALDHVRPSSAKVLSTFGRTVADAATAEIHAFDLATGAKQWTVSTPICDGITYDAARDRLIVRARQLDSADSAPAEGVHTASATAAETPEPVAVKPGKQAGVLLFLSAKDGSTVSQRQELPYRQLSLVGDRALMSDGTMLSAIDGAVYQRPHPLTGKPATMRTPKNGCNGLLMSASFAGNRGFWNDLDGGLSGGWGGQDFACKPSFIPAGGLINIWNAGAQRFANRTDTHPRTLESTRRETNWASSASIYKALEPGWINRLGVEPAAPGYRSDKAGGWWVPTDGGGRASVPGWNLRKAPGNNTPPTSKRPYETADHRVVPTHGQADIPSWVSGFGIEDPGSLIVPTAFPEVPPGPAPRFRVRLIVSEPDEVAPGQRIFRVVCNGQTVVESLDVAAVAGGRQRSIVREWQADGAQGALRITYERTADSRLPPISGAILVERIAP